MAKPVEKNRPIPLRPVASRKSSLKATIKDQSGAGKIRIGELLCKEGHITSSQLQEALTYQKKHKGRLGSILIRLGYIEEEAIVMRILDPGALNVDLIRLGFEQKTFQALKRCISRPYGLLLVTGPTGSGKTTTLYSILNVLNKEDTKMLTAEDPVEFNFKGINQVNVRNEVGMTFAATLRSFLRQDPDVIMVGEIRDMETAEIAIKAAMTGHLVFSTLHTRLPFHHRTSCGYRDTTLHVGLFGHHGSFSIL